MNFVKLLKMMLNRIIDCSHLAERKEKDKSVESLWNDRDKEVHYSSVCCAEFL